MTDQTTALTSAAALLHAAATSHEPISSQARLHCLSATIHLVGGAPETPPDTPDGPETLIRNALAVIGDLPPEALAAPAVLSAAADARRALLTLS